jgi:transposase
MRLKSKQARDFRWQTVIRLYQAGKKQGQIAQSLLISQSSVSRIISRYQQNPGQLLETKAGIGSKKRLTAEQLAQVKSWASQNPENYGFEGQYWTRGRFKLIIKEKFGIDYQLSAIGNLLKSLQVSLQKPLVKDYRQKSEQVEQWKKERLPAIKKSGS